MSIERASGQISWRVDGKAGDQMFLKTEAWPAGAAPPPLPSTGDRVRLEVEGRAFFVDVLEAYLTYRFSGRDFEWISNVRAQEA